MAKKTKRSSVQERIYIDAEFSGIVRKYLGEKGWYLGDNGEWIESNQSEGLIEKLPFYKLQEQK